MVQWGDIRGCSERQELGRNRASRWLGSCSEVDRELVESWSRAGRELVRDLDAEIFSPCAWRASPTQIQQLMHRKISPLFFCTSTFQNVPRPYQFGRAFKVLSICDANNGPNRPHSSHSRTMRERLGNLPEPASIKYLPHTNSRRLYVEYLLRVVNENVKYQKIKGLLDTSTRGITRSASN